jgi:TonB family protein
MTETETIDPRAVKIMSDILALTIDEQDGVAVSAIERIRRQARESAVTGGGLKEVFRRLIHFSGLVTPGELEQAIALGSRTAAPAVIGRLKAQIDALRSQLTYSEQLRLQDNADHGRQRRKAMLGGLGLGIVIGFTVILLTGATAWALFPHALQPPSHQTAILDFRPAVPEALRLQAYPAEAVRRGARGAVELILTIDSDGTVSASRITHGSGSPVLDEAARQWAWSWRFRPALSDSRPIASTRIVRLRFGEEPKTLGPSTAGSRPLP